MKVDDLVEHKSDLSLGQGRVTSVKRAGGGETVRVKWENRDGGAEHTAEQLLYVPPLPERLANAGVPSRIPFQLKILGRWFEARHALTGELSNQPFQMLPHQVIVTNRVVNSRPDNRAWLVADDVGLGKTIEAGMIMEVLRKKTLGRFRCLIVTPAGLREQWQEEMKRRFRRKFRLFESRTGADLGDADQLIASIDTLKLKRFNVSLASAPAWDLVIFDEAHHLATETKIQAYQLAENIRAAGKARNLLFLTATPHSGNNEHFFNMIRLLRPDLFPPGNKDGANVSLKDVMIRNRKSDVTDIQHNRIFKGIGPAQIITFAPAPEEVAFYEELQGYLKTGYNVADRPEGRGSGMGFLMSMFGKLASSSRAAIRSSLENRRQALLGEVEDEASGEDNDARYGGEAVRKTITATGIAATGDGRKKKRTSLIDNEVAHVEGLIAKLDKIKRPDAKLTSFVEHVKNGPNEKLLIFTEFRATQDELVKALRKEYGERAVATIHGSMKPDDRTAQVALFNEQSGDPRFMVSTEAGGEGLNMQKSCHIVVNYDLPWNPMALQQRIGRVYRYGQQHPVVVFNLKVDSKSPAFADQRVYEYLERKIDEITKKLREVQDGNAEDIRGEVLGQVALKVDLMALYKTAVKEGEEKAKKEVDTSTSQVTEILNDLNGKLGLFRGLQQFNLTDYEKISAKVTSEQLDFFVGQYLGNQGSVVTKSPEGLLSFRPPARLVEIAKKTADRDSTVVSEPIGDNPIERATVKKELAQTTLNCRLLRFGDPVFDGMVRHVQHGGFSAGVATLDLPAEVVGWGSGTEGTWILFNLRILRQDEEGGAARVLRNELASVVVPRGGEAVLAPDTIVERLHDATDGPGTMERAEAERAYAAAYEVADAHLAKMRESAVADFDGRSDGLLPDIQDAGMAWVRAS